MVHSTRHIIHLSEQISRLRYSLKKLLSPFAFLRHLVLIVLYQQKCFRMKKEPHVVDFPTLEPMFTTCVYSRREYLFRSMTVIVVAYSITSLDSLREAETIMCTLRTWKFQHSLILIGLKADLQDPREVSTTVGENMARTYGASFKELSAADSVSVQEFFGSIAELLPVQEKLKEQPQELGLWSNICKFLTAWN